MLPLLAPLVFVLTLGKWAGSLDSAALVWPVGGRPWLQLFFVLCFSSFTQSILLKNQWLFILTWISHRSHKLLCVWPQCQESMRMNCERILRIEKQPLVTYWALCTVWLMLPGCWSITAHLGCQSPHNYSTNHFTSARRRLWGSIN